MTFIFSKKCCPHPKSLSPGERDRIELDSIQGEGRSIIKYKQLKKYHTPTFPKEFGVSDFIN